MRAAWVSGATRVGVDLYTTSFGPDVGLLGGGVLKTQKNTGPSADITARVAEEMAHHAAVNKHATSAASDSVPSKWPSVQNLVIRDAVTIAAAQLVTGPALKSHRRLVTAVLVTSLSDVG